MRAGLESFAAKRRSDQDDLEKVLYPEVSEALQVYPAQGWYNDLLGAVTKAYVDLYHREGGKGRPRGVDVFLKDVRSTLDKTKNPDDSTASRVSTWLATALLNAATMEAEDSGGEFVVMEWVTMHDDDVRLAHRELDGQQRPPGEPFQTGDEELRYPGDPTAPIELWINCRCALAPVPGELAARLYSVKAGQENTMTTTVERPVDPAIATTTPWYGVLAPEGVWSGDGRQFAPESLTHRDLPMPLTWQKATDSGHDGSVTVAKIERIERRDGQMRADGQFLACPEADEVIGLIAEFGKYGVSVDADDAEFEFEDSTGRATFTAARISSASILAIPAFAESFVTLGTAPPGFLDDEEDEGEPCDPEKDPECVEKDAEDEFASEKPWSDFTPADYTDEQWKAACVMHVCDGPEKTCHKLPIKEPGGTLNKNAVHAAAARFNQVQGPTEAKASAKRALRGAYKELGEEPPEVLAAAGQTDDFSDIEQFLDVAPGLTEDGPGWLTHPVDTDRLRDYWVHGPGAAKIGWGAPGDFNRCRTNLAEYVKPQYLSGYCANRHFDALGYWPGAGPHADAKTVPLDAEMAPAVSLVAAAGACAPSEWFANPCLVAPTPLTITDEGRVFGHLAEFGTCHTGFTDVCVQPPHGLDYSYFLTGEVVTDAGPVPVGQITMAGSHAKPGPMRPAMAHYDNTCTAVADVSAGEDEHGIWLAGWVRPGTSDETVVALRASALSGDWRRLPGSDTYELIAALAVNSPGFPIPRVGIENGQQVSLVAAGALASPIQAVPELDVIVAAVLTEMNERQERRQRIAELAAKIGGQ